ncbi:hypothetical protein [Acidocella sp.]|uniref:hypothetical protein n=1 Tax=Acidocella sp. TaxID=50710 RepID=UPI00260851AB|nr:hypothetical protein [Acidocella sp.]MDD2795169.1 hypothetical protein [Acidocella sp.]
MGNELQSVLSEIVALARVVLNVAGTFNNAASGFLTYFGIAPTYQLYLFLVLMVMLTVAALRTLGGMLGWLVMLLMVVLLIQRVVPGISASTAGGSSNLPVVHPLNNAL